MDQALNPAADDIRAIVELERQAVREAGRGERLGQMISNAVGTMGFVVFHTVAADMRIGAER